MNVEEIAKICHEVNRGLCVALGDHSQLEWDFAEQWQRDTMRDGVRHALRTDIEVAAETSHEHWMQDKIEAGWIYGEPKNAVLKIHPCLLPFADLPPTQQLKDRLFITVVRGLS